LALTRIFLCANDAIKQPAGSPAELFSGMKQHRQSIAGPSPNRVWIGIVLSATAVSVGVMAWLANPHKPLTTGTETSELDNGGAQLASATVASPPHAIPAPNLASALPAPDPESVEGILAALASPDKATRTEAIENAKQLADRSVAPLLQAAAERLEDPAEKAALLAAIDFINLPSFADLQQAQSANRLAAGLPPLAQASFNRYKGKPFQRASDAPSPRSRSSQATNPSRSP
jgi:hypothetical protein